MKRVVLIVAALALSPAALAQTADHDAHHAAAPAAEAVGVVRAVDAKVGSVTIAHQAIPALGWPAMTMPFKVADPALLKGVAVGAKVRFQLQGQTIVGLTVL
jgi:Cu(I)/Ag(I) efflux system protein CusF